MTVFLSERLIIIITTARGCSAAAVCMRWDAATAAG